MNQSSLVYLCDLNDLPDGASRGFKSETRNVFVLNQQGNVFVYHNRCPHLGIPLEWEDNQFFDASKTLIQCANHGALFVINTGQCVAGPCIGRKLTAIPYTILNNQIWISSPESKSQTY